MAAAAIFVIEKIKQTTGLAEVSFNSRSGYVAGFKLGNITYRRVEKQEFRLADQQSNYADGGYYPESDFLDYLVKKIDLTAINAKVFDLSKIKDAEAGDLIKVRKLKIVSPYTSFCKVNDYTWTFDPAIKPFDELFNILVPANATANETDIPVSETARTFYTRYISLVNASAMTAAEKDQSAYLLALIALRIDAIHRDLFSLFQGDADFQTYIASQDLEWREGIIIQPVVINTINAYNNLISDFYNAAYSNQRFIVAQNNETKLYWLASILNVPGLSVIPAYNKLKILQLIVSGAVLGATSGVIPFTINEEAFAVNIAKSVGESQADDFLGGLINFYTEDGKDSISLFNSLYDKVNNFGPGDNNLTLLMKELYRVFLFSSYNPYNLDGSVKTNLINPAKYANKPATLDYSSGKFLWIFNTSNYDFRFKKNKIEVYYTVAEQGDETVGIYDIYQTLTLVNDNNADDKKEFLSAEIEGETRAAVPIFYLKYLDDKKVSDNISTAFGIAFDVVIIFSGIGNLSKLRHLRMLTALGRLALEIEGSELIAYELFQGAVGVVEISTSTANIILNYGINYHERYCVVGGSEYDLQKCHFYETLNNLSLVLQLVSGPIDNALSGKIQLTAQNLLSNSVINDLHPDVIAVLQKFAGGVDLLRDGFRQRLLELFGSNDNNVWIKVNSQLTVDEGNAFILQFRAADSTILKAFNEEDYLVNRWREFEFLKAERSDIQVLKAFHRFKILKPNEFLHLRYRYNKAGGHWQEYLDNGTFLVFPNKADSPTTFTEINGHILYENIYYENLNSAEIYNGINVSKKTSHFIFNPNWNEAQTIEEISFAFAKKTPVGTPRDTFVKLGGGAKKPAVDMTYRSFLRDGTKVEIILRTNAIDPVTGSLVSDAMATFYLIK